MSDAADRPGPFVFPLVLSLTVDASLAGPVTVTVEGLDWDTLRGDRDRQHLRRGRRAAGDPARRSR